MIIMFIIYHPLRLGLGPRQAPIGITEEWVLQALALIKISKNMKTTVSKTEGVLDGT